MKTRFLVGVLAMGWCLTPSGSIAGTRPGYFEPRTICALATVSQPAERTELVDERTGAQLRLTARANGAVQVRMTWPDFDFRKVMQPNGDFTLLLAGSHDVLTLIRTGDRLRVTRNGKTAVLKHTQVDEAGLEHVQQVLAGSRAMRMFRALHGRLSQDTLASVPGIIVDVTDVQVGVLQGDGGVLERRRAKTRGRMAQAGLGGRNQCYDDWESDVMTAWVELEDCVNDTKWVPGGPEVCAFVWTVQVEGAWFKYLSCCSFPLKIE